MKNTLLGLMAATLLATPVLAKDELVGLTPSELKQIAATQTTAPAAGSWRTALFTRIDSDTNGRVSVIELEQTGCRVNKKFFAYANANRDGGLTKNEFFKHRELFSRCK
jgi:hypothetical protein